MSAPRRTEHARHAAPAAAGPFGLFADAALPRLAAALDPEGMSRRFAEGFAERARGSAPRVSACEVEEVYYRPGRHCGILYRVRLDDHEPAWDWLYARLLPRDLLHERFEKAHDAVVAAGASALARTTFDPVSLWDDLGMIVWTFPNDPKLPGLRGMADVTRARRRLALERTRLGLAAGRPRVSFERVKYMPTKRCVLRYRVGGAPNRAGNGSAEPFVFYAK